MDPSFSWVAIVFLERLVEQYATQRTSCYLYQFKNSVRDDDVGSLEYQHARCLCSVITNYEALEKRAGALKMGRKKSEFYFYTQLQGLSAHMHDLAGNFAPRPNGFALENQHPRNDCQ